MYFFCRCRRKGKQFLIELIDISLYAVPHEKKIYDYCVSVLLCLRQYPPSFPKFLFFCTFYSCDFQISISFMSQKCQNLLPLKSIASKGIDVMKRERKNRSIFLLNPPSYTTYQRIIREKVSLSTTSCRILCGYRVSCSVCRNLRSFYR